MRSLFKHVGTVQSLHAALMAELAYSLPSDDEVRLQNREVWKAKARNLRDRVSTARSLVPSPSIQ